MLSFWNRKHKSVINFRFVSAVNLQLEMKTYDWFGFDGREPNILLYALEKFVVLLYPNSRATVLI